MVKKSISKRSLFIIITATVLLLFVGCVGWLFYIGRLAYFNSGQHSIVVCGTDIVDRFNVVTNYEHRNDPIVPSIDEQGMKDLVSEINAKKNFNIDPTCQMIILWSAVYEDNYNIARGAYDSLINLHKDRIFADSNLRINQPLSAYEEALKGLTGSGFSSDGSFGG